MECHTGVPDNMGQLLRSSFGTPWGGPVCTEGIYKTKAGLSSILFNNLHVGMSLFCKYFYSLVLNVIWRVFSPVTTGNLITLIYKSKSKNEYHELKSLSTALDQ